MQITLHGNKSLTERKLIVENHELQKKLKRQSEMQSRINALMDVIIKQRETIAEYREKFGKLD